MQLSRALRFRLNKPKNAGGVSWGNMDPSLKHIATKAKNPWVLEGTPLKKLDQRLRRGVGFLVNIIFANVIMNRSSRCP